MKKFLITAVLLGASVVAHADSWFQIEAGIGAQKSSDMGDGIWLQQGVPYGEHMSGTAYMIGATGEVLRHESLDVRYHADYLYFGGMSADCTCVPDANYNAVKHVSNEPGYIPFNGGGHTQGLALTIEPGYTWHGIRFGVEAGPWISWSTWHETQISLQYPQLDQLSHKTAMQVSLVAGASVSYKNFALSYRHFWERAQWNPNPGMVTGTDMLMVSYRF